MNYLLVSLLVLATGQPDQWPAFLGAGATPIPSESVPLHWSPTEQIAWQAQVPGHGQSSPVIYDGKVFVTSVEGPNKETFHTLCFDLNSGEGLWRRSVENSTPVPNSYYVSRAAPTPAVDADRVMVLFESGDCVAYDHAGDLLWQRAFSKDNGPLTAEFGLGASPCQTESKLFVLLEPEVDGVLLAIDKVTGKTVWQTPRKPRKSWSSPAVLKIGESTQVVVSSDGTVDGFDAETGDLLWTFDDIGGNTATTPIDIGEGRFLVGASPGRNGEKSKFSPDSNGMLQVSLQDGKWTVQRKWAATGATPSWASPIVHQGLAYWINRAGVVYCFDVASGEKVYTERSPQSAWATPVGIGDRIYLFGKEGLVTVLAAGREYKVLAENETWNDETLPAEPPLSTEEPTEERRRAAAMFARPTLYGVAIADGKIVMRVGNALFCAEATE